MTEEKKKEETALAERQAATAVLSQRMLDEDDTKVSGKDLILPKVLLMQGLSGAVTDSKAAMGEIRDSLENKLLAEPTKPLEFVPFYFNKTWVIFEKIATKGGDKLEYVKQIPWSPENDNWEWDTVEKGDDGKEHRYRRDQSINVYCLLASEIKEGIFMPYVISFRRTSYVTGKALLTTKEKLKLSRRAWASKVFALSSVKTENELGTFYKLEVATARDSTPEELEAVAPWFDMIKTQGVKVDESDLKAEGSTAAQPPGTPQANVNVNVAGGGIAY